MAATPEQLAGAKQHLETFTVDPERLADGHWCERAERTVARGDITASYSADRIAMDQPIRSPFRWRGGDWLSIGSGPYQGARYAEAYRLMRPQAFAGEPVTYAEKQRDGDASRSNPNGFYHGVKVRRGGEIFVLCGPPALFMSGQCEQLGLFEAR